MRLTCSLALARAWHRIAIARRTGFRNVPYSLLSVDSRAQEPPEPGVGRGWVVDPHAPAFVSGGAYALLCLFGAAQGMIGCFQYSWGIGRFPAAALGFCALILVTCVSGAAAMRSAAGALLPAIGWFLVSMVLTLPTSQGSVIVTNTAAGEWYLYGGSASAAAGVLIAFVRRPARGTGL